MAQHWEVEKYLSEKLQKFLEKIDPSCGKLDTHSDPNEVYFPKNCIDSRISSSDSIHNWFQHMVDDKLNESVKDCSVEKDLAVFAHLKYKGKQIDYACIQVIKSDGELLDYYYDDKMSASYFRLDYDIGNLGRMFKESLPHIHTIIKGEPRFVQSFGTGNIVLDFFDFIYRNFYYEKWLDWAKFACRKVRVPVGSNSDDPLYSKLNVVNVIEEAFKANQYELLTSMHKDSLLQIKSACQEMKDKTFAAKIDVEKAKIIGYS